MVHRRRDQQAARPHRERRRPRAPRQAQITYTPHDTGDFVIVVNADKVALTGARPAYRRSPLRLLGGTRAAPQALSRRRRTSPPSSSRRPSGHAPEEPPRRAGQKLEGVRRGHAPAHRPAAPKSLPATFWSPGEKTDEPLQTDRHTPPANKTAVAASTSARARATSRQQLPVRPVLSRAGARRSSCHPPAPEIVETVGRYGRRGAGGGGSRPRPTRYPFRIARSHRRRRASAACRQRQGSRDARKKRAYIRLALRSASAYSALILRGRLPSAAAPAPSPRNPRLPSKRVSTRPRSHSRQTLRLRAAVEMLRGRDVRGRPSRAGSPAAPAASSPRAGDFKRVSYDLFVARGPKHRAAQRGVGRHRFPGWSAPTATTRETIEEARRPPTPSVRRHLPRARPRGDITASTSWSPSAAMASLLW